MREREREKCTTTPKRYVYGNASVATYARSVSMYTGSLCRSTNKTEREKERERSRAKFKMAILPE